ncbi:hypothetical protein [Nocardiopsis ansamitocini]|uniref:Uncharacterized protein n=1 Tax=Nocardiopsis ansamitocini TaxID=1670832 RepID=A0A9W6P4F4_9ACTN|nr:hypothetical protein [Nocardiopsis ansamitocini]GLU47025.1 hypothetical protein Nans01_13760 [Nocardiopsis ansamitocini]
MARKVSEAPSSTARQLTRRRRRSTRSLGVPAEQRLPVLPGQRTTEVEAISARPRMTWILVTDEYGRSRPEARWS